MLLLLLGSWAGRQPRGFFLVLSFNADFSSPLQRIKISTVANRVENREQRKETQDRAEEERRYQMDVRICV